MKLHKCFRMALNMVLHSRLRSWLTILGIVIGVASVIAILSIGDGMEAEINSQFDSTGGDIVTITPGFTVASFGPGRDRDSGTSATQDGEEDEITRRDVLAIKSVSDVEEVNTIISGRSDVYYQGGEGSVTVTGVDPRVYSIFETTDILEGRYLTGSDSNVIVIGERLSTDYFERELGINQMLIIEGRGYRVVGILEDGGTTVYMPISEAYSVLEDKQRDVYDSLQIKIADEERLDEIVEKIDLKLMNTRHVNENNKDFTITSNAALASMRSEFLSTMTTFLAAIAGVSLIVGAVGVANTMFTSVLEKTKEIGIMKAIGARNADVLIIFVLNSGLIGLVGGLLGVGIGALLSMGLSAAGMTTLVTWSNVFMILIVSVMIGMVSGLIPAINASKLSPVDALRSE